MEFQEFKRSFDQPGFMVLFGGKRKVLEGDANMIGELGRFLVLNTEHITFRTGNANGSDSIFAEAIARVNSKRLQSITPYEGHRKSTNYADDQLSLDKVDLASEPAVVYQSKANSKTRHLIDDYVSGKRDRFTMKASYIIRDTWMVIGGGSVLPASCAIFYDDLGLPKSGGTGHTMNVCQLNSIPFWDQRVWRNWIK